MNMPATSAPAETIVKTKDLYFAAFLKTAGMPFVTAKRELDETTGKPATFFHFERLDTYTALKRDYFSGSTVTISPQALSNEIKTCKYLAHNPD